MNGCNFKIKIDKKIKIFSNGIIQKTFNKDTDNKIIIKYLIDLAYQLGKEHKQVEILNVLGIDGDFI